MRVGLLVLFSFAVACYAQQVTPVAIQKAFAARDASLQWFSVIGTKPVDANLEVLLAEAAPLETDTRDGLARYSGAATWCVCGFQNDPSSGNGDRYLSMVAGSLSGTGRGGCALGSDLYPWRLRGLRSKRSVLSTMSRCPDLQRRFNTESHGWNLRGA